MSHISLTYHIVWRTKRNKNTIREQYERELYAYILGICQSKSSCLHRINPMPDHIHLCVEVSPKIALSDFVKVFMKDGRITDRIVQTILALIQTTPIRRSMKRPISFYTIY